LLLLALVLAICGGPAPAVAHDIGVSRAELIERQGHRYVLSVQAGPALADRFSAPLLPQQCGFAGNPRGTQGAGWRSFEFTCDGGLTAADRLDLPWRRDGVMLTAKWLDGSEAKALFRNEAGVIAVPLSELHAGSGSWLDAAKRYTTLGVEHILLGIDHLLFVLGLLLIVQGSWMLVKTITAFTIAHSITLGLATVGFVTTPPRAVDAAIALSIVFLAVEILHARQGRFGLTYRYPWVIAFGFGLLHGLGFAGALTGIGLPQSEIPVALLFFNVGVEIGQLMFVCAFLLLRWSFRQLEVRWSRPAQAVPVYLIGTAATYWLMQRIGVIVFPV
jgi:uncharacterized Tic20 family protein